MSSQLAAQPAQLVEVDRWPDHLKELVYQVWWMRADQNARQTCRLLSSGTYGADPDDLQPAVEVPRATVDYWIRTGGWHARAAADRRSLQLGTEERVLANLGFGLASGVAWLRAVAEGTVEVKRDRERLDAVRLLAELSGWVGPDRRHAGQRAGLAAGGGSEAVDLAGLSDAELAELERGSGRGR